MRGREKKKKKRKQKKRKRRRGERKRGGVLEVARREGDDPFVPPCALLVAGEKNVALGRRGRALSVTRQR